MEFVDKKTPPLVNETAGPEQRRGRYHQIGKKRTNLKGTVLVQQPLKGASKQLSIIARLVDVSILYGKKRGCHNGP